MVGNVLVNCAHGKNNPEEATVAFIAASAAVTRSTATAVFLSSDAVRLATPGYADGVQAEGYEPLKVFLDKNSWKPAASSGCAPPAPRPGT